MPNSPNRVALDRVDWCAVLPVLRLAGAFRQALQPGKLFVALVAVVLLHGCGVLMDLVWGDAVSEELGIGVYESVVIREGLAFRALIDSALSLELGLGADRVGVADALLAMAVATPAQAFDEHPWFVVLFGLAALIIFSLASGVICRMSAAQVCSGEAVGLPRAVRFVLRRGPWYILTPLLPTLVILILGGVLMLAGLILFNLPGLDVVGALLYGVLLLLGFVIAGMTVLLLFAVLLMPPALSVEGTDGFDAIARSFNYVLYKPWQFAGYLLVSIGYLAAVYLLVAAVAGLTVGATNSFVGVGAFNELNSDQAFEMTRFEALSQPSPRDDFGRLIDLSEASSTLEPSAWIVARWYDLLAALVAAVMFSVVCCLQTQVYVRMRRTTDGTPVDECAADEEDDPWSDPSDVVDSASDAASPGPSTPDEE